MFLIRVTGAVLGLAPPGQCVGTMRSGGHSPESFVLARMTLGFTFQEKRKRTCIVILGSHRQQDSIHDNVNICIAQKPVSNQGDNVGLWHIRGWLCSSRFDFSFFFSFWYVMDIKPPYYSLQGN